MLLKNLLILTLFNVFKADFSNEAPIHSSVLFPYRFNKIVFFISRNCTEQSFKKLLNSFILLEKFATENTSAITWQTIVNFGLYIERLNSTYPVENLLQCRKCFEYSRVNDMKNFLIGPAYVTKNTSSEDEVIKHVKNTTSEDEEISIRTEKLIKNYELVISDVCILGTDRYGHGLMLESIHDLNNCRRGFTTWDMFNTNLTSNDLEKYANMKEEYAVYPYQAKVNFMAIIKNTRSDILYDIIKCKIFNPKGLCREKWHAFIGLFKIISDDEKKQRFIRMALPLYFTEEESFQRFMDNYEHLMKTGSVEENNEYNCEEINKFLKNVNVKKHDMDQYNVLIIEDSFLKCLDLEFRWRNDTKRSLEIIVLHSEMVNKEPYENIIYQQQNLPETTLNHMWFFNTSDENSASNFCEFNTLCESEVPYWKINECPQLEMVPDNINKTPNYMLNNIHQYKQIPNTTEIEEEITTKMFSETTHDKLQMTSDNVNKTPNYIKQIPNNTEIEEEITTTMFFETSDGSVIGSNDIEKTINSSKTSILSLDNNSDILIIGGVIMFFIFSAFFITLIIWKIRKITKQKSFINEIQCNIKNSNFNSQVSERKHCELFLESKKVVINFDEIKGKGAYATVFTGSIIENTTFNFIHKTITSQRTSSTQIAIKIQSKFENNEAQQFLAELNSLTTLKSHSNIIKVLGWSLLQETPILITELADTDLLTYVRTFKNHQNPLKFGLQFLWQISDALNFVTEKKMIHRDVACRNILLLNSNIAKLADFGLCCYCDKNGIFKDTMQKKFPVKWLSIEALRQGLFSDKSDVWAFGVLCFEVFSYGEIPYSMIEYPKMLEILKEGTRLEKPKDAPTYLYELMQDCWEEDTDKRPTFKEINRKIKLMLEQESVKYGYVILS